MNAALEPEARAGTSGNKEIGMPGTETAERTFPARILLEEDWGEKLPFSRNRTDGELFEEDGTGNGRCREEEEWLFA